MEVNKLLLFTLIPVRKYHLGKPYFIPYYDENSLNIEYYSLNLVSKALTAHDSMGVELALNNTGGIFYACSAGDSSMNNLGDEFTFSYPTILGFRQDNTLFETTKGKLQLLCHTKKAALDDISCYAYISLETVCDYMTKDGYFTDFTDNGSGVWSFTVRKPSVKITIPENGDLLHIGDELTVEADIKNVTYATLSVGEPNNGHSEDRDNLVNEPKVKFRKFKLTEAQVGNLHIRVGVHTGGTAIQADIDSRDIYSDLQIRVEERGDKESIGSVSEFKNKFGDIINELAKELGVDPNLLAAVILVESSGSGFVDGNLKIRFENHYFIDRTEGYADLFYYNPNERWKDHKFRVSVNDEWRDVHTGQQSSEYAAFDFAKSLDEESTYRSISMGLGQIMGANYESCEHSSAKEMFEELSKGHEAQISGMATFFKNYNNGNTLKALQNGDLESFVTQYNGPGQVSTYTKLILERKEDYENA